MSHPPPDLQAQAGFLRVSPRLQVLAAGTGRDGTMSLARLLGNLAAANGVDLVSEHELYANHVCNLMCRFHETGHQLYRQALSDLLAHLPAHAICGTTYQFGLDLFFELYGPKLKLIHLKRRDRAECIRSLARIIHYRPALAMNMTTETCRPDCADLTFRVTAWHLGECDRREWNALPLEQRLGWHYDKTHALLDQAAARFPQHLSVATEELGDPETVARIARFLDPCWSQTCPPVHVNSRALWEERAAQNEAIRADMLAEQAPKR
jgi:hypothetical protein